MINCMIIVHTIIVYFSSASSFLSTSRHRIKFPFSELSFFRFFLFRFVIFKTIPFQNCHFPDVFFSELSFFKWFLFSFVLF